MRASPHHTQIALFRGQNAAGKRREAAGLRARRGGCCHGRIICSAPRGNSLWISFVRLTFLALNLHYFVFFTFRGVCVCVCVPSPPDGLYTGCLGPHLLSAPSSLPQPPRPPRSPPPAARPLLASGQGGAGEGAARSRPHRRPPPRGSPVPVRAARPRAAPSPGAPPRREQRRVPHRKRSRRGTA